MRGVRWTDEHWQYFSRHLVAIEMNGIEGPGPEIFRSDHMRMFTQNAALYAKASHAT